MTMMRGAFALLVAIMPAVAAAQTQTEPVRGLESLQPQANAQAPAATAIPIPSAPTIVLPTARPTPPPARRSSPPPVPAVERPRSERAEPRPTTPAPVRETPQPVETPPAPVAQSTPTPPAAVAPVITSTPAPAPASQPAPTVAAPQTRRAMPFWLWALVIVVVLAALWALRRRRPERPAAPVHTPRAAAPDPVPEPALVAPVAAPSVAVTPKFLEPRAATPVQRPRARLSVELRPLRAGLNMLSATAECELVVTNSGDAPAERIRVGVALLTAHAGQDADLVAFNEGPIGRPATPAFALAPGERRSVRTVAAIPRDAIRTMTAAGRPMFVPILATNLLYATDGAEAQSARAWAMGIERVDSAKLAPFWLDGPARMYDAIAARPHAATLER